VTLQRGGERIQRRRLDPRRHRPGDACGQKVVRQHDARSAGDRPDLVPAIGVEGDQLQRGAAAAEGHDLAVLLDRHFATAERRRKRDDKSPDHSVVLLRILVRHEEIAPLVEQHVVQLGLQGGTFGEAEPRTDVLEQRDQRGVPARLLDADAPPGDLPAVPYSCVEYGTVAESVAGRLRDGTKFRNRRRRKRQIEGTDAFHLDAECLRRSGSLDGEGAGRRDALEQIGDVLLHDGQPTARRGWALPTAGDDHHTES
jgi:hypothetical protein